MRPFNVRRLLTEAGPIWVTWVRSTGKAFGPFDTQGEAIDFCYKNWPWYP